MYNEAIERLKKYAENFEVGDPKKEGEHRGSDDSTEETLKARLIDVFKNGT